MKALFGKLKKIFPLRGAIGAAWQAVFFAAAWLFLPFWLFLLAALYLYFIPFFGSFRLFWPFAVLIFFSAMESPAFFPAVLFGAIFYLILGIKELAFMGRKSAYEILVMTLAFFALIKFFEKFDSWESWPAFVWAVVLAAAFFLLARGFLKFSAAADARALAAGFPASLAAAVSAVVLWQFTLAALFLPINFLYQAAAAFLVAAISLELVSDYSSGLLTRRKALIAASVFLSFMAVIMGLAQWTL